MLLFLVMMCLQKRQSKLGRPARPRGWLGGRERRSRSPGLDLASGGCSSVKEAVL